METKSKYPYTRNDKAYGFEPGEYLIPSGIFQPGEYFPGSPRHYIEETIYGHNIKWFYFDGKWIEVKWDDLLDPLNLRLRREYNEELAKLKK